MRRLSIEITQQQHQRLKAVAALHGQSIKDYVLERALPQLPDMESLSEEEALRQLEEQMKPRIEAAEKGQTSARSVRQIFKDVQREQK